MPLLVCAISAFALAGRAQAPEDMAAVERGRQAFRTVAGGGCAACHGQYAEGRVGPPIRGVDENRIQDALDTNAVMNFVRDAITPEEVKAIAAYTQWMGRRALVTTIVKQGAFIPATATVHPGTPVELGIENAGAVPVRVTGEGAAPVTVPGGGRASLVWIAPEAEGKHTFVCAECAGAPLAIEVSKSARPFIPQR